MLVVLVVCLPLGMFLYQFWVSIAWFVSALSFSSLIWQFAVQTSGIRKKQHQMRSLRCCLQMRCTFSQSCCPRQIDLMFRSKEAGAGKPLHSSIQTPTNHTHSAFLNEVNLKHYHWIDSKWTHNPRWCIHKPGDKFPGAKEWQRKVLTTSNLQAEPSRRNQWTCHTLFTRWESVPFWQALQCVVDIFQSKMGTENQQIHQAWNWIGILDLVIPVNLHFFSQIFIGFGAVF